MRSKRKNRPRYSTFGRTEDAAPRHYVMESPEDYANRGIYASMEISSESFAGIAYWKSAVENDNSAIPALDMNEEITDARYYNEHIRTAEFSNFEFATHEDNDVLPRNQPVYVAFGSVINPLIT